MGMKFSIITVALNPGDKLKKTLDSIFCQTCTDYEIIVKDGGSTDGSTDVWKRGGTDSFVDAGKNGVSGRSVAVRHVRFYEEKDKGIYDAMNQAVPHAEGEFILFLNCGDVLADEKVLERVAAAIERERVSAGEKSAADKLIFYGDTLSGKTGAVIASPPQITGFTCYRNIPCHQSCFYSAALCREKPYDLQYRIRADYDHFLWCFYRAGAGFIHMDFPVASYEGGGYSESRENRERDKREHRQITESYMSRTELMKYRTIMALTLAPLRTAMAESRRFSGIYHWLKECLYQRKKWFMVALLLFLFEVSLMIWPVGWVREDYDSFLTGEGMWYVELTSKSPGYSQEFVPKYSNLKSIGIFLLRKKRSRQMEKYY